MTADVINLRRARKDKARQEKHRVAAENRAAFGRTMLEKERALHERERFARELDRARIVEASDDKGGQS